MEERPYLRYFTLMLCCLLALSSCSWFTQEDVPEEEDFSEHSPEITVQRHDKAQLTKNFDSRIGRVSCSQEEEKITFMITNLGSTPWSLDRSADPQDDEFINVRVFFNNQLINSPLTRTHPTTGERLYGPNKLFSENCGAKQVLRTNTSTQCTLQPVLLQETNTLRIESTGADDSITFRCEG